MTSVSPVLQVQGLVKRFGGLTATDGLDLAVQPGEIHAIIGPNGAGKTTLINQLSGELRPDAGTIRFDGDDVTALQNVMLAVQGASGRSFSFWRPAHRDAALTGPAQALLEQVGLGAQAQARVATLAYGARRQLEIAMTLALRPKVMLLDEPMAGTDPEESQRMAELIDALRGTYAIVLVEHDMDAVFALADRLTVVVYGRPIACGTPAQIRNDPEVRSAYLGDPMETA
jgi:branched-chain amino acid transport system ATP-binding protein